MLKLLNSYPFIQAISVIHTCIGNLMIKLLNSDLFIQAISVVHTYIGNLMIELVNSGLFIRVHVSVNCVHKWVIRD